MKVDIKIEGIKELMAKLDPNKVRLAANSALNKVATQGKNEASRQIRTEYNIKASDVNKNMKLTTRARGNQMEAEITGTKRGMALSYFGAKQIGVIANKMGFRYTKRAQKGKLLRYGGQSMHGGAVSVEVRKGARKALGGDPKPFVTKFKSGHVAVVQREGKTRTPIKQLLGPGIALLFGSKKIMDATKRLINKKFNEIFKHELEYRLKK